MMLSPAHTRQDGSVRGIPGRDRPLGVALVNAADRGGGAEASTLSLHNALRKLGHESNLYVGKKFSDDPNVHEIQRFRCFPGVLRTARLLEIGLGWQYLYHPWFRRLDRLLGSGTDVLHLQSLWSGRFGYADVGALPRLARLYPTLMTLRDMWMLTGHCGCPAPDCERWKIGCGRCPDLGIGPPILRDGTRFNWRRKRRTVQHASIRITAVSQWLADQVRDSPIFAGKNIHTVYNGIEREQFYPRSRSAMRAKHGLPQDAFIVMLAGQSVEGTPARGPGARGYALEALTASGIDSLVLAVGHSSGEVMESWQRNGVAVPFQDDPAVLAEFYAAADVTLVASLWETFGRVPAESQMCGTPVVAFDTGGIPEVVSHGETGLVVDRLNSAALGVALRKLHDNPELRSRLGEAAALRTAEKFSNMAIAKTYVDHYCEEISERREKQKHFEKH